MLRSLLRTAKAVLLVSLAVAIGLYASAPYLERAMTFRPAKYDPSSPWRMPADTTDVYFMTSDDLRLHGWFLTGAAPTTGITVLLLHGNAGNLSDLAADATILQIRGFNVFLIDYRGFGKSDGDSLGEATLKSDGAAALRYLATERSLDPATIALFGYSLGTAIAVELSISSPCRAVVLVAPLASARRQAKSTFPWLPNLLLDRMHNGFDTVGRIARANCPVMVVHGDNDEVIAVTQGRSVFDAAPEPKRLVVLPGGRHWLATSVGRGYLDEVAAFFVTAR